MDGHGVAIQPPRKEKAKYRENGEVKKGRKSNSNVAEHLRANPELLLRLEARLEALKKARGRNPPLKRGGVKKAIAKELIDAVRGYCCSSNEDVDSFLEDAPFPRRSEPMANFWPEVEMPLWEF